MTDPIKAVAELEFACESFERREAEFYKSMDTDERVEYLSGELFPAALAELSEDEVLAAYRMARKAAEQWNNHSPNG